MLGAITGAGSSDTESLAATETSAINIGVKTPMATSYEQVRIWVEHNDRLHFCLDSQQSGTPSLKLLVLINMCYVIISRLFINYPAMNSSIPHEFIFLCIHLSHYSHLWIHLTTHYPSIYPLHESICIKDDSTYNCLLCLASYITQCSKNISKWFWECVQYPLFGYFLRIWGRGCTRPIYISLSQIWSLIWQIYHLLCTICIRYGDTI